jgi:acetyl-CoA synthetase (ADP-forming)
LKQLDFSEAEKLIKKYRIRTPDYAIAKKKEEAVKFARKLGWPVVLKIISPDIIHKTEKKAVVIGICDEPSVGKAFDEIRKRAGKARFRGILVQSQAYGKEVIIGGKRDPQFGAVVLFGLGGIFVEVLKDVSLRIAPIDKLEALKMMKEIRGYPILAGARGEKPVNMEKLAEMIVAVSRLISENGIQELDLNPVFVNEKDCLAVDVRMIK